MMNSADKIAAAILSSATIKTIPGVRLNSMELEDLYRHFLTVVCEVGVTTAQSPLTQAPWNGKDHQQNGGSIGIGIASG
jgi:hypothetical protein